MSDHTINERELSKLNEATVRAIEPFLDAIGEAIHKPSLAPPRDIIVSALIEGGRPLDALNSFYASAIQTSVGAIVAAVIRAGENIDEAGNAPEEIRGFTEQFIQDVLPIAMHSLMHNVLDDVAGKTLAANARAKFIAKTINDGDFEDEIIVETKIQTVKVKKPH